MTLPAAQKTAEAAELAAALYVASGNVQAAATSLGMARNTFYMRCYRRDVDVEEIQRQFGVARAAPLAAPETAAQESPAPEPDGPLPVVTLSLTDFAVLQAQAAYAGEADRLEQELSTANRIIAILTRQLEACAPMAHVNT